MSESAKSPTRRDAIRQISLALTAASWGGSSVMARSTGAAVHQAINQEPDGYTPRLFKSHEWQLLSALAERILPADDVSGSALDAGAPEFIDLLCSVNEELEEIFISGMLFLDHEMNRRFGVSFANAETAQQEEMLTLLAAAAKPTGDGPEYEGYSETMEYQGYHQYLHRGRA